MKTTKLILVAALMAFATIGFSQTRSADVNQAKPTPELSLNISLTSALHNPGLVGAMRAQLDPSFLTGDQRWYTVPVRYRHQVYYVSGSLGQWKRFFSLIKTAPAKD
jgi:hypothetical protein